MSEQIKDVEKPLASGDGQKHETKITLYRTIEE